MKRVLPVMLLIALLAQPGIIAAQGGIWTWIKGDTTLNNFPTYGTQGVPALFNDPGGFYEAANWIDRDGKFWIFGGLNHFFQITSDLWKYDPLTNEWTWMKGPGIANAPAVFGTVGVPAVTNNPGARGWGATTWTDNNGDLWLFGGLGFAGTAGFEGDLNDLWKYNTVSNMWTCIRIPSNEFFGTMQVASDSSMPPGRSEAVSAWVDSVNNLWFFGGYCIPVGNNPLGCRNDLWK
jgi:hypothetical protein